MLLKFGLRLIKVLVGIVITWEFKVLLCSATDCL